MKNLPSWLKERIKQDFDTVYEIESWNNYVEVKGSFCGDLRCYRYYSNGSVCER